MPVRLDQFLEEDEKQITGEASFYQDSSVDPRWGGLTKSGEKFDETKLTAAVRPEDWETLKGKTLRVTNLDNEKSVEVKVNDTGGFGKYGRKIDLSKGAFQQISDPKLGKANVRIEVLGEEQKTSASPTEIQKALKDKGYDPGTVDGIIGPKTKTAIKQFQADKGLKIDGIVGPKTMKELFAAINPFAVKEAGAAEEEPSGPMRLDAFLGEETSEVQPAPDKQMRLDDFINQRETLPDPREALSVKDKMVLGITDAMQEAKNRADIFTAELLKESPFGIAQRIALNTPYLTPAEEKAAAKYPGAAMSGGVIGSALSFTLAAMIPQVGLSVAFGATSTLQKTAEIQEHPEKNLDVARNISQEAVSGVAGSIMGIIFASAQVGKTILNRLLMRSSGAGATAITESITNQAISGEKIDVKAALMSGGLQAVTIGIVGGLVEVPQLRGLIIKEADRLIARYIKNEKGELIRVNSPVTDLAEAKGIVKKAGINPEQLSPEFQRAIYETKRKAALEDIKFRAQALGFDPKDSGILKSIIELDSKRGREELLTNYLNSLVKTDPAKAKALLPFFDQIKTGADPVDILIAQELANKLKPQTKVEQTVEKAPSAKAVEEVKPDDTQGQGGVQGVKRVGEKPGGAVQEQGTGGEKISDSGILQKQKPSAQGVVNIPEGWKTEIQSSFRKPKGWKAEVDWRDKRIVFETKADSENPEIINHEIAHIQIEDKIGYIQDLSESPFLQEYAKLTGEGNGVHVNFIREHAAMDYGEYLTNPAQLSPEKINFFKKYFPSRTPPSSTTAKPEIVGPGANEGPKSEVNRGAIPGEVFEEIPGQGSIVEQEAENAAGEMESVWQAYDTNKKLKGTFKTTEEARASLQPKPRKIRVTKFDIIPTEHGIEAPIKGVTIEHIFPEEMKTEAKKIYEAATQKQTEFDRKNLYIGHSVGAEYHGQQKKIESMLLKVARKNRQDYNLYSMKDHVRGTFEIKDWSDFPKLIETLKLHYDKLIPEDFIDTPLNRFGYRGLMATTQLGDGINAEFQFHTPESAKIKKESDKLYRKWRPYEDNGEIKVPEERLLEYRQDMKRSEKMWNDYWDTIPRETRSLTSASLKGLESVISPNVPGKGTQAPLINAAGQRPSSMGETSIKTPLEVRDKSVSNITQPPSTPSIQPTEEEVNRNKRITKLVGLLFERLHDGNLPQDPVELRKIVEEEVGGNAKEYYDEIYDALELALNEYARKDLATDIHKTLFDKIQAAKSLEEKLPLRQRSLETIKMQQFSTPLTLATAANYSLDPQIGDIILEPTAGTGNLVIPFARPSWTIVANELDKRRLDVLRETKIKDIEITDQDFLAYKGTMPTAIISNPPFGGLSTGKYASFAADFKATNMDQRFIAKMLRLLPDGGRIAVITSEGTGSGTSGFGFRKWLEKNHTLIASIASPEGAYKYRGSPTIGTSLLIIEKGKLRGKVTPIMKIETPTWSEYASLLEGLRRSYPRLDIQPQSAILKAGGETNVPVSATPSSTRPSPGGSQEAPSRGSERGGGQEPTAGSVQRPTDVSAEPPTSRTGIEDDIGQGVPRRVDSPGQQGNVNRPSGRKIIGSFVQYQRHNTLPVSNPHPSVIVESQELSAVNPPKITYQPGKRLLDTYKAKNISDQAMDIVLQALQSIKKGKKFVIADDVGVGKTREMAGIALDALDTGMANRVLYVTVNPQVLDNHITGDFAVVMAGQEKAPLPFPTVRLESFPNLAKQANLPVQNQALYTITRDIFKRAHERVLELGFDLIIIDEAHQWRPENEKQAKAIAWKRILNSMRDKSLIFATATPGVDLGDLHYLSLEWEPETFDQYLANLTGQEPEKRGMFTKGSSFSFGASIPLTQQFMREMKMKGLYASRDLSRENVKFSTEQVPFTNEDIQNYDKYIAFLKKAYSVGVKYAKFNKVKGRTSLGLIKAMMQNAAKRYQVDQKLERILSNIKEDIAAGKRVFLFTSGLNELDPDAPKGYLRAVINAINEDAAEMVEGEVISDKIPEAIEEKELLLDELKQFPQQLSIEKYVKDKLGKQYRIGYYTGNTTTSQRKKYLRDWNAGLIDVMLGSDAAKTAISAHDVIGKPIVNYYLDIDFEVTKFKQALGRTNRAGEKTSPEIIIPHLGAAGEQKFISTVAVRMKNLGATSKGQAESGVVDFLSEFDLEGAIANQAARNVFARMSEEDKALFLNEKLWEYGPDGERRPRRVAPNDFMIDNYLFDLNFMPYADGKVMFDKLIKEYKQIVESSAELTALRAERVAGKKVKEMVLFQNKEDPNDYVLLHDVVDKSGQHFGIVTGMLLDKTDIFLRYGVKNFIKFTTPEGIISGKKVLPSYIQPLAKAFNKDVASSITPANAYEVIQSGDKVPVINDMQLYKRKDGLIAIRNAKMADKNNLVKAGAGFSPAGSFWALKSSTKEAVREFLKYYPIAQANADAVAEAEAEIGKTATEDIQHLGAGPTPTAFMSQRRMVNDTIQGVTFSDPEVERRYQEAKGVEKSVGTIIANIRSFFNELWNRATRTYPTLPNDPEYAQLRNTLNRQQYARQVAQDRTIRAIEAITSGFGPNKLDLFTRKVILEDLTQEAASGRALPFGYSTIQDGTVVTNLDALNDDLQRVNNLIRQNPDIQAAIDKRKRLWDAITAELVNRGILKEDQVKANYFRHQVLEYARTKATFTSGKRLRTPKPGYAKKRGGSTYDINTNYVQAEFEVMAQALHDIETAKNIKDIEESPLNIIEMLREQAKEETENTGNKVTWQDIIPEGSTTWQPAEGNIFYSATSLPQKIVNEVLANMEGTEISPEDLRKILAIGGKKKQFVLPQEVADTLNNLYTIKNPNFVVTAAKSLTTGWKRWILFNPRRAFKYNYQNFIGDFDAAVAGDPRILKYLGESFRELTDVFYRGKPMPHDMREFFERGGLSAQMTVNELPDLKNLEVFERLLNQKDYIKSHLNLWRNYWNTIGTFTSFRESLLRYAAYKHYKSLFGSGHAVNYGASMKDEIDALTTTEDKAAKVASELLGDYGNISAFGKEMRELALPFFSWYEINFKRYPRLLRNAFSEGFGAGAGTAGRIGALTALKGSAFLVKWMLRVGALTLAMMLYNQIFHGDDEEELSEYDRNRLHIVLGRDKNGNVRIIRGQGALADFLEWFGLDSAPTLWREYLDGKASLADLFGRIPFTDLPAFGLNPFEGKIGLHPMALKMIRAISPIYKLPFELMTGKQAPVFDDASWKIEDKLRHVLRSISLENEYDLFTRKPSRGYGRSLAEAFITTQDPGENAYRYIQGEKYKWLETHKGRGGSGDYYSPNSILYRQYRKALFYKDEAAQERIKAKMDEMGITQKDLKRSLETADPLSGLSRKDRAEFINHYLTQRDREVMLDRAMLYYRKTFKGEK